MEEAVLRPCLLICTGLNLTGCSNWNQKQIHNQCILHLPQAKNKPNRSGTLVTVQFCIWWPESMAKNRVKLSGIWLEFFYVGLSHQIRYLHSLYFPNALAAIYIILTCCWTSACWGNTFILLFIEQLMIIEHNIINSHPEWSSHFPFLWVKSSTKQFLSHRDCTSVSQRK